MRYVLAPACYISYDNDDGARVTRHNSREEIGYLVVLIPW